MRSIKVFLVCFLSFSFAALQAQVDLNNGLLVHLPFNGTANDTSGNGLNGFVYNAALATDRCGNSNSAYSFNGVDSYIEIPSSSLINDYYSFSLWVNAAEIPALGGYCYPFSIGAPGGGQNIALCNNDLTGWSAGAYNFGTPVLSLLNVGTQAQVNKWYHLVLSRDAGKIKLYINGQLNTNEETLNGYNASTGGNQPNYGNSPMALIGGRDLKSQFHFNGLIDDVRIYNRSLNQKEIDSLYHEKPCFFSSVDAIQTDASFSVFPNPSNGLFTITTNFNQGQFTVLNILGETVYTGSIENTSTQIDLAHCADGIYTILVEGPSGILSRKIVLCQ